MKEARIYAIAMLWVAAYIYSSFSYGCLTVFEERRVAEHCQGYILAGYLISATIAALLLTLVFFRWKWKDDAGFGWVFLLTSFAFGVHLALACISDLLVGAFGPGLPVMGESGSITLSRPHTPAIIGQFISAVLYSLTFPLFFSFLAIVRGIEEGLSRRKR